MAQEEEFQYDLTDTRCKLWFFQNKLPGYAWYVPKEDGYVNVGLGGFADQPEGRRGHAQKSLEFTGRRSWNSPG